jgi:hypothetical protein
MVSLHTVSLHIRFAVRVHSRLREGCLRIMGTGMAQAIFSREQRSSQLLAVYTASTA